jgi:hypothetical protein
MEALRIAPEDDTRLEGWLVPFDGHIAGGKDSYNTRFSARTAYALDWFPAGRPLLYQHGMDAETGIAPVGRIDSLEVRDAGVWMQAQLDKGNEYFEAIREMVKAGKLFLSSGSVEHLVQIDARSGEMLRWPIVEGSLTPTPANLYATVAARSAQEHFEAAGLPVDETLALIDAAAPDDAPAVRDADAAQRAPDDDGDVGGDERSFEDICSDLDRLLNPMYASAYTQRLDTFPTHVLVKRYDYGDTLYAGADPDDGCTYWDIPYTIGADQEPVLGTPARVERNESFTPVARAADLPVGFHAQLVIRHVSAFADSTEGYGERRFREGREMSASNLQTISDAADGLEEHARKLRDLHAKASARKEDAARAAAFSDPETVRLRIKLLELAAV